MFRNEIVFTLNGKEYRASGKHVFSQLSDYLRYERCLTGTKVVCAEGDCGACSVSFNRPLVDETFRSLNSCIALLALLDGCHLISVEVLGTYDSPHEIQKAMVEKFGAQCGFCTPGFVMSLANMFEHKKTVNEQNIKNYLTGNLCRCTGYSAIIDAAKSVDVSKVPSMKSIIDYDILTENLQESSSQPIFIEHEDKIYFAPVDLGEAVDFLKSHPDAVIVSGASDLGVRINKGHVSWKKILSLHLIESLYRISINSDDEIEIGCRVTLDQLQKYFESLDKSFNEFLNIFASPQIKNIATLVGNLVNGSPIADTTPYFISRDAKLKIVGSSGVRFVDLDQFYLGYKKLDLKTGEIVAAVILPPFVSENERVGVYKVSQRRDLDISCVNASFVLHTEGEKIVRARIAYGGMGPVTTRVKNVEKFLIGKEVTSSLLTDVERVLCEELTPISDVRGTSKYRMSMAIDLFRKFLNDNGVRS